jgi:hypothetical protein
MSGWGAVGFVFGGALAPETGRRLASFWRGESAGIRPGGAGVIGFVSVATNGRLWRFKVVRTPRATGARTLPVERRDPAPILSCPGRSNFTGFRRSCADFRQLVVARLDHRPLVDCHERIGVSPQQVRQESMGGALLPPPLVVARSGQVRRTQRFGRWHGRTSPRSGGILVSFDPEMSPLGHAALPGHPSHLVEKPSRRAGSAAATGWHGPLD